MRVRFTGKALKHFPSSQSRRIIQITFASFVVASHLKIPAVQDFLDTPPAAGAIALSEGTQTQKVSIQ